MLQRLGGSGRFCDSQFNIDGIKWFIKECETASKVVPAVRCLVISASGCYGSCESVGAVMLWGPPAGHHYPSLPPSLAGAQNRPVMSLKYYNKLLNSRLTTSRLIIKVTNNSSSDILLIKIGFSIVASGHVMVISFIGNVCNDFLSWMHQLLFNNQ